MTILSRDAFTPWVGDTFDVRLGEVRLPMTLTAAEPLAGSLRDGGGFRLEFLGPADPALPQSIMAVEGPAGQHDIFLVPIARQPGGVRYEAVFY